MRFISAETLRSNASRRSFSSPRFTLANANARSLAFVPRAATTRHIFSAPVLSPVAAMRSAANISESSSARASGASFMILSASAAPFSDIATRALRRVARRMYAGSENFLSEMANPACAIFPVSASASAR